MPKVLVINDDRAVRDFLTSLLKGAGYSVVTEPNGARVEEIVAQGRFDAIVTGLYMPITDGIETIGRVRRKSPHIPIIGMAGQETGVEDPCGRAMMLFGALDVFTKPIDCERLLATLASAISKGDPLKHAAGTG